MQLVNRPEALPGQCKGCGAADRGPYVDTTWSEEYYGAIYFCRDCVLEMAFLYGAISPEAADKIKLELAEAKQAQFDAEVKLRSLSNVKETVDAYFSTLSGINSGINTGPATSVNFEVTEPAVVEPAGPTVESSDGEGPGELLAIIADRKVQREPAIKSI